MKENDIRKLIFNIKKIKHITSKKIKKNSSSKYHNVHSFEGAYNGLDHHNILRETPQLRLTPHLHPKP